MINDLQTINRFLASIKALEVDGWAKIIDVEEYYTTQYVYPIQDSFTTAKNFCETAGLAKTFKEKICLDSLGITYLSFTSKKTKAFLLEPNLQQKDLLSREVFLNSEILDQVKEILYHFSRDENGQLQLMKQHIDLVENQNLFYLLLKLKILIDRENTIEFSSKYGSFLEELLRSGLRVISPELFQKLEIEKLEISKIAEKYVLLNERSRLKSLAALKQSANVEQTSLKNVAAGYDIASYNDQNSENYDRFIEVKAGKFTPIKFFLSRNELETSKRLGVRYHIYYVCIKDRIPQEVFIFTNPAIGIMKDPNFDITVDTYEIREK